MDALPNGITMESWRDPRDARNMVYRFTDARTNQAYDALVSGDQVAREMDRRGMLVEHPVLGALIDSATLAVKAQWIGERMAREIALPHLLRARFQAEEAARREHRER